jgi:putative heme degradation protein
MGGSNAQVTEESVQIFHARATAVHEVHVQAKESAAVSQVSAETSAT